MTLQKVDFETWCYALASLHDMPDELRYNQQLFRILDTSASHARSIVDCFEDMGWIVKVQRGKIKYIRLTEEGTRYAEALWPLIKRLRKKYGVEEQKVVYTWPRVKRKKRQWQWDDAGNS